MLIASRRPGVSAVLLPFTLALIVGLSCIAVGDEPEIHRVKSGVDRKSYDVNTRAAKWHSLLLQSKIEGRRRDKVGNGVVIPVSGVHSTELHVIVEFINSLHPDHYQVDQAADWILKRTEYLDDERLFNLVKAAHVMQMRPLAVALAARTDMYDASDLSERIRRMEPVPAFQFHFGLVTLLVNAVDDDQKAIDRIIRHLLVFGGDINQLSRLQWDHQFGSVLHWAAASEGKELVVDLLCRHVTGINLNRVNAQGYTPLHLAVLNSRAEVVNQLVATSGINVNARDAYGHTPLSLAATRGGMPGAYDVIVSLTQDLRVDIVAEDVYGNTAWDLAQRSGSFDVMYALNNALVIRQNAVGERVIVIDDDDE
ncbi:Ankyrin repeat domain-containing protein [Plasmodiophora brassicae]